MRLVMLFTSSILLIIVSVWAYNVNYKSRSVIKSVNSLSSQIQEKQARIKLLKAEWTYLNRPNRLNKLMTLHFPELQLISLSHENYLLFDKFIRSKAHFEPSLFDPTNYPTKPQEEKYQINE